METNGGGRLFIQTLLPEKNSTALRYGDQLHTYYGESHPPEKERGREPQCRIEVVPGEPAAADFFLHVLTATDSDVAEVPLAEVRSGGDGEVLVEIGDVKLAFAKDRLGGWIDVGGGKTEFADEVIEP
jgi:hypothetical protein